jgi:predicted nucleic acid-binding protein
LVLVDTSVWIDYFNGIDSPETALLDRLLGTGRLLTGDLILAELLQGFVNESEARRAYNLLVELPYRDLAGREVALAAAKNYRVLRARGVTVRKTIDILIGTYCLLAGHELLHADRDFDVLEEYLGLGIARE